jgi:hypothetical protein
MRVPVPGCSRTRFAGKAGHVQETCNVRDAGGGPREVIDAQVANTRPLIARAVSRCFRDGMPDPEPDLYTLRAD